MAPNRGAEPRYKVIIEKNLAMRTRDGIMLRADVYRPDASGKFPVLVMRTPYDKRVALAHSLRPPPHVRYAPSGQGSSHHLCQRATRPLRPQHSKRAFGSR